MRVLLALLFLGWLMPSSTHARPLVAELSSKDILIHSAFNGTQLILFGTRNDSGDIVVVVRGVPRTLYVRKKERVMGIWMNRASEKFEHVPSFYAMASSRPYEEIPKSVYFNALAIGYAQAVQSYRAHGYDMMEEEERARRESFAHALLTLMQEQRLYAPDIGTIQFIGGGLFRTSINFPDNTPTGSYAAEIYLMRDGEIISMHTTPIYVRKTGLDAWIYNLAHQSPALYGMLAIALAALGGTLAIRLFAR
ncbi:MAG: hypothetical protein EAY76_04090 [Alphaproteobacteria bacterium]|nr:MAG: hypothetical protein EAY76_04090 [Alphaproteobacteria bacterium]TAF40374.1 MAG: hypothetical protein EAZ66_03210 [Alphaproteobacteria bacterium]TAF77511.1 MAG: hypothetical protein EAZ52_00230 [Alphaproteobacteria bacterium]